MRPVLFAAGVWLAERLPAPVTDAAAQAAGRLIAALPAPPRRRLRRNLAHVLRLPEWHPRVRDGARRVYALHALNYADLLRERRTAGPAVARRFEELGDGWAFVRRAQEARQGFVLATAHFGRMEILSNYLGYLGVRLTLPVEHLQPPALFELVCSLRTKPTFTLVPHDAALRPCLRALARGDAAVLFADWDSTGNGVPVRFFGAPARLPAGPAILARRAGVPLLVGLSLPASGPDRYCAAIEPPLPLEWTTDQEADLRRAMQAVAGVFERYIGRYPDRWVMFHAVWSPAPGDVVECRTAAGDAAAATTTTSTATTTTTDARGPTP